MPFDFSNLTSAFSPSDPKSYDAMELRKRIALAMVSQRRGYPKTFGEGLSSIGDSIGDAVSMRALERAVERDAAAKTAKIDEVAKEPQIKAEGGDEESPLSDTRMAELYGKPGAEIVPPRAEPDLRPDPNRRVYINEPTPAVEQPQQEIPTEAPIATVQPRSLQPPPGPAALAQSMSPSANPLLNQYPVEPTANAPFPGPDVAQPQVPQSVAQRQPVQAPPPGNSQGLLPPWLGQTAANGQRMTGPQPIGGSAGPSGAPQPQAMADPRQDIAMSLAQRGPGGPPPPNPMMGGQTPARMPNTLMSGGGLSPPPNLSLAGSPPEAAGNRQIMSDISAAPTPAPGAQMAQAAPPPPPPAPRPVLPPAMPRDLKSPAAPLEPIKPAVVPEGARKNIAPASPPRAEDVPYQPGHRQMEVDKQKAIIRYGPEAASQIYDPHLKKFEDGRAKEYDRRMKLWDTKLSRESTQIQSEEEFRRGEVEREQRIRDNANKIRTDERNFKMQTVLGVPENIYVDLLKKGSENNKTVPAAQQAINTIKGLLATDQTMFTGGDAEIKYSLAKWAKAAGWPDDPRVANNERFKTAIAPIVAQARLALVGGANVSDADRAAAEKAAGGNVTMTREAILETMVALERINLAGAMHHQEAVGRYAKALQNPDGEATIYRTYGVPGFDQLIPQASINKLFKFGMDPNNPASADVHRQFDEKYHTPGLSRIVIRTRRPDGQ